LGLKTGETITVLAKHEHGWWYGQSNPEKQGYFPKNYVRKKTFDEKPASGPTFSEDQIIESEHLDGEIIEAVMKPFSISSLAAFDELVDSGMTVEIISPSREPTPPPVYEGAVMGR
jgi:hypothetical protein